MTDEKQIEPKVKILVAPRSLLNEKELTNDLMWVTQDFYNSNTESLIRVHVSYTLTRGPDLEVLVYAKSKYNPRQKSIIQTYPVFDIMFALDEGIPHDLNEGLKKLAFNELIQSVESIGSNLKDDDIVITGTSGVHSIGIVKDVYSLGLSKDGEDVYNHIAYSDDVVCTVPGGEETWIRVHELGVNDVLRKLNTKGVEEDYLVTSFELDTRLKDEVIINVTFVLGDNCEVIHKDKLLTEWMKIDEVGALTRTSDLCIRSAVTLLGIIDK